MIGILRGSSSIDASFQEWLEQLWPIPGGFQRAADELGLEKEDIIQEATLKFQKYKEEFPHPPATGYNDIYICGVDATGKGVPLDRYILSSNMPCLSDIGPQGEN